MSMPTTKKGTGAALTGESDDEVEGDQHQALHVVRLAVPTCIVSVRSQHEEGGQYVRTG